MQFYFRLNYPTDLDLIVLRRNMGSRFPKFVKQCLRAQLTGKEYEYDAPGASSVRSSFRLSSCSVNIRLDETLDADLINFIRSIPERFRSQIVKRFIWGCCAKFPADLFLEISDYDASDTHASRTADSDIKSDPQHQSEELRAREEQSEKHKPDNDTTVNMGEKEEEAHDSRKPDETDDKNREDNGVRENSNQDHTVSIDSDDDMMAAFTNMLNH